jgi:hypothetical protein
MTPKCVCLTPAPSNTGVVWVAQVLCACEYHATMLTPCLLECKTVITPELLTVRRFPVTRADVLQSWRAAAGQAGKCG